MRNMSPPAPKGLKDTGLTCLQGVCQMSFVGEACHRSWHACAPGGRGKILSVLAVCGSEAAEVPQPRKRWVMLLQG